MVFNADQSWAFQQVRKTWHIIVCELWPGNSTDLLCFAANYEVSVVKNLPPNFQTGVYCGWASVKDGEVHKMVMSVGWNPFYHNKEKSMVSC